MTISQELQRAIKTVEEAGGIVMFQEDDLDDVTIDGDTVEDFEKTKFYEELEERREAMREDFHQMIGSKNFSVTAIEDMVHGHGLDLDDLEDLIHNM